MQKITVVSSEIKHSKDGTKTFYVVTDNTGAEFSSFDASLATIKAGDIIECEITAKGNYININEGFKVIPGVGKSDTPDSSRANGANRYGTSAEVIATERRSIERQTSLKLAIEFRAGNEDVEIILQNADLFYHWISSGEVPKTSIEKSKPIINTTQKDKVPLDKVQAQEKGIADFKTAGELVAYACRKMKKTANEIYSTLGIKSTSEIKDLSTAYKVLFE